MENSLDQLGLKIFEKIDTNIFPDATQASKKVAKEIANLIHARNQTGQNTVLGLATGSTPLQVYAELVRIHKEEGLSFKRVITFNLDEYYPMQPEELQSYVRFMHENLFDHIDIKQKNIHIPDGTLPKEKVYDYCRDFERWIEEAGGLDVQILGIGRTGHIGFNEPGSLEKTNPLGCRGVVLWRRACASPGHHHGGRNHSESEETLHDGVGRAKGKNH